MTETQLPIYQSSNGAIQLQYDESEETFWITQKQLADIFDVNIRTVNEHIQTIYKTNELDENATIRKFRIVQTEGKRRVEREVNQYNLDATLAVGYRVNSAKATRFRQWTTEVLKQHITQGYTINQTRLKQRQEQIQKAIADFKNLAAQTSMISTNQALELIQTYSHTWFMLDHFDRNNLPHSGKIKNFSATDAQELQNTIAQLKQELIKKGEASTLFASEKQQGSLAGIYGNIMQEAFGQQLYSSLEEKAAHLLYFIIKNHPFNDGNKRSAALAFIWFLNKNEYNTTFITPDALTTLTLLIATSAPGDKPQIIGLILEILGRNL